MDTGKRTDLTEPQDDIQQLFLLPNSRHSLMSVRLLDDSGSAWAAGIVMLASYLLRIVFTQGGEVPAFTLAPHKDPRRES